MPELSGFEIDHRNPYHEFSIRGRCSLAFNTAVLCKISSIRQGRLAFTRPPSCHSLALNVVRGSTQSLQSSERLTYVAAFSPLHLQARRLYMPLQIRLGPGRSGQRFLYGFHPFPSPVTPPNLATSPDPPPPLSVCEPVDEPQGPPALPSFHPPPLLPPC